VRIEYNEEFIIDQFSKHSDGSINILELYRVNTNLVISDIYADPYTKLTLDNNTTITGKGRLKLYVEIREPIIERDTSIVVNLSVKNGLIEQVTDFETPEFDTLPDEADASKIIDPQKLQKSKAFLLKCVQVLISIMNAIINSGNWKITNNN